MPRGRPAGKTTKSKLAAKPSQPKRATRRSRVSKTLPAAPAPEVPVLEIEESVNHIDFDPNSIQNYEQLMAALQVKKVQVTLGNNIIAPENILINYDVAINLNGFSIISEESVEAARVLDIRSGAVTLTGQGKIFAMGPRSVAIRVFGAISPEIPDYTTLTVDEGISIFAPDAYGILISPNLGAAYGLTVNFAGQIFAHDGICLASGVNGRDANPPMIKLQGSAGVTADETSGIALEAAGLGHWQVGTARLRSAVGASLRSGVVEFTNAQIMASVGSVFQLEDASEPTLELTVDGGNYVSEQNAIFAGTSAAVKKLLLKNGEFYGQSDQLPAELKSIAEVKKAAHFRTDIAAFKEDVAEQERLAEQVHLAPASVETSADTELPAEAPTETVVPEPASVPAESDEFANLTDDELIELAFAEADTPKRAKRSRARKTTPKSTPKAIPKPFTEQVDEIPELTDLETDEDAIVFALNSEKVEPSQPVFTPPEPIHPVSEQDAARVALGDAISDIRKLSAEDYDVGFGELEAAIKAAEKVLADPLAELPDIRDAASNLLLAFDGLEERDELSLSDAELDELFYHGAVLGELVTPAERKIIDHHNDNSATSAAKALDYQDLPNTPTVSAPDDEFEPDFAVLSDVLTTISELQLDNYTEQSRMELLQVLDEAQAVLTDLKSPQSAIDEIATSLVGAIAKLEPMRALHSPTPEVRLRGVAPAVGVIVPAAMLDEMSPVSTWSQGITMIDELEPFLLDASAQQKILRTMKPWLLDIFDQITLPVRRLGRSLRVGVRTGITAYRDALNANRF